MFKDARCLVDSSHEDGPPMAGSGSDRVDDTVNVRGCG